MRNLPAWSAVAASGAVVHACREPPIVAQSTAIITSEALTTTITAPPVFKASSSTASLVIAEVMIWSVADIDAHMRSRGAFLDLDESYP